MKISNSFLKKDNDQILRQKLSQIVLPLTKSDEQYLEKMISYIDASYNNESEKYNIKPGVAIAANQVGWDKRAIYIHTLVNEKEEKYLLFNPKIIAHSKSICFLNSGEGCLSVDKKHEGYIKRWYKIIVKGYDYINKSDFEKEFEGYISIVFQHEIDHLEGILYYDHINPQDKFFKMDDWIEI